MFAAAYIIITAMIAAITKSRAAIVAIPALVITTTLFNSGYAHAGAVSSGLWALSGAYLLINSEYVAGTLYGISGIVYVAFYLGASNETLSVVPIISDVAFLLGLVIGSWPSGFALAGRNIGRFIRWIAFSKAKPDSEGNIVLDRSEA